MAGEFVADSEVPAAPEVVEVKKAVKGKRTGKKAQIDVIEQAVVETATMVIEEATLMEEAPVIEERNKAAPVPEALMETKKVRGKRVAKKTQVDAQVDTQVDTAELLQTEPVETPPILIEAMVEEEARVEEPVEIAAVEAKKVRGKRVGKKAQDFVETAPILTEVITAPVEAPPQVVENLAADCVEDPEAMCEEAIPLAEVKKALKGKRGGRKAKVAQKAELPELMETEAVDEEAEQAVEEVQENKTVKAIVSQFEQLTVGVVAEEVDGTPVVETDTKMQEIVVAEQVDDIDQGKPTLFIKFLFRVQESVSITFVKDLMWPSIHHPPAIVSWSSSLAISEWLRERLSCDTWCLMRNHRDHFNVFTCTVDTCYLVYEMVVVATVLKHYVPIIHHPPTLQSLVHWQPERLSFDS